MNIPSDNFSKLLPHFSDLKKTKTDDKKELTKTTTNEKIRDFFHLKYKLNSSRSSDANLIKNTIKSFQTEYKLCTKTLLTIDKQMKSPGNDMEAHVQHLTEALEKAEKFKEELKGLDKILKGSQLIAMIRSEVRSEKGKGMFKHSSDFTKLSHAFNEKIKLLQFLNNLNGAEHYFNELKYQFKVLDMGNELGAIKDFDAQKKSIEDQLSFLSAYVQSKQNDLTYSADSESVKSFLNKINHFMENKGLDNRAKKLETSQMTKAWEQANIDLKDKGLTSDENINLTMRYFSRELTNPDPKLNKLFRDAEEAWIGKFMDELRERKLIHKIQPQYLQPVLYLLNKSHIDQFSEDQIKYFIDDQGKPLRNIEDPFTLIERGIDLHYVFLPKDAKTGNLNDLKLNNVPAYQGTAASKINKFQSKINELEANSSDTHSIAQDVGLWLNSILLKLKSKLKSLKKNSSEYKHHELLIGTIDKMVNEAQNTWNETLDKNDNKKLTQTYLEGVKSDWKIFLEQALNK